MHVSLTHTFVPNSLAHAFENVRMLTRVSAERFFTRIQEQRRKRSIYIYTSMAEKRKCLFNVASSRMSGEIRPYGPEALLYVPRLPRLRSARSYRTPALSFAIDFATSQYGLFISLPRTFRGSDDEFASRTMHNKIGTMLGRRTEHCRLGTFRYDREKIVLVIVYLLFILFIVYILLQFIT